MAVSKNYDEYEVPEITIGPKTAAVLFYTLIAIAAMAIAIPLALMSEGISLF